jgi:hypothetical protein
VAVGVAGLTLVTVGVVFNWRVLVGGMAVTVLGFGTLTASLRNRGSHCVPILAITSFLAISIAHTAIIPVFNPTPMPELAMRVAAESQGQTEVMMVGMQRKLADQLRLLTGPNVRILEKSADDAAPVGRLVPFVVFPEKLKDKLELSGYRLDPCGYSCRPIKARHICDILLSSDKSAAISQFRVSYCLATRVVTR